MLMENLQTQLEGLRKASALLAQVPDTTIQAALNSLADLTLERSDLLLTENRRDLERMDPADPKYDRLLLDEKRLAAIAADLRQVASLPSPLGKVLSEHQTPNGLHFTKISVPIGVIGIVYESRPNVTFDVSALCLKSGNAVVLKGSRDAHYSNLAIVALIHEALAPFGLADTVLLAPSEREALGEILQADRYIDALIPRGGQGLIDYVRANSKVPVIETGAGVVHVFVDKSADLQKARAIIENAKARRVSVCNALDTLLLHRHCLIDLHFLLKNLGAQHQCVVYADAEAYAALQPHYPADLLFRAEAEHYGQEFLSMKMAVRTVPDIAAALEHIARYSSRHSEAIVAEDAVAVETFLNRVDAAVVYANASTAFTDGGQFGFGAEIGISTQKLHARGPMALPELCGYKWVVRGTGQVR